MSASAEVVAIGEEALVGGFALVGVRLVVAETADAARMAWTDLIATAGLVVLTPAAAAAIGSGRFSSSQGHDTPLSVVLPDG